LAGGQTHYYQLTLSAGQYLHLIVEQRGIDLVVMLLGPGGEKLAEVDSPNGAQGPEAISLVTEVAGSYRLEVRSLEKSAAAGRYEAKIAELRAALPPDKERIAAERAFAEGERWRGQGTAAAWREALKKYEEARAHWQAVGSQEEEAHARYLIGFTYSQLGEYQPALDHLGQALALQRAAGNRQAQARTLNTLGGISWSQGETSKALDYYGQALPLRQAAGDRRGEALTLHNIAAVYSDMGEKQQALDYLNQALGLFRALGDRQSEAGALNGIGAVYHFLGENQKALDYYGQALPLRRATGDRRGEATTLQNIGTAYNELNERPKALESLNQSLALFQTLGDRSGEANTLSALGRLYSATGEKQQALAYYQRVLQLVRAINHRRGEAYALHNLGRTHYSLGELPKALDYYQQALALVRAVVDREGEAGMLYSLARAERDRGQLLAGRTQIETALDIIESLRSKVVSLETRSAYFASKQDYYAFSIDLLQQLHQSQPAQGFAALALQTSERARARTLLESLTEVRADLRSGIDPALLARERALQQRLNAKEQVRTQLLARQHTPEQAAAAAKELRALITEYQELEAQIRITSPRYAALTSPQPLSLKELQQQVLDADTLLLEYALGEERSYLWAVTTEAIASFELPKRAVIEAAAKNFYQLLAAPDQPTRTAQSAAAKTAAPDRPKLTEAASALSRMLLAPAAEQLGNKRLLIVAEGALQYLPFAALPEPETGRRGDRETGRRGDEATGGVEPFRPVAQSPSRPVAFRPLIVDHEIVSLPSASTLAVLRRETAQRKPAAKALAILADPVFSREDARVARSQQALAEKRLPTALAAQTPARESEPPLTRAIRDTGIAGTGLRIPRLPGTRREAAGILALVPAAERRQAFDFEANRATAMSDELSQYRIVHFATHGLLNSTHPELSGIVLSLVDAEGKQQDGFLRLHEIYNLRLPVELVVLSACQTGLGKEIKGEGLVGLVRGFMYAGAARVMASLWKVDDRATSELMQRFYRGLVRDQLRPAAALRAAQVAMWEQKRWEDPYYWAAFCMQGEWK
jgi:tetratricopeptide (TPR) repeat protein